MMRSIVMRSIALLERWQRHLNAPKDKKQQTARNLNERFTDLADWVSAAMGTPINILVWLGLVALWFAIFWSHPALANSNFLPQWFTGTTFNFPLNTVTTLAELYIGFLVAAASNRVERRNREQTAKMEALEERIDTLVEGMATLLEADHVEHGRLLRDIHSHTLCTGHTIIAGADQQQQQSVEVEGGKVA